MKVYKAFFSQLTRTQKFLPRKLLKEREEKRLKLETNKFYNGVTSSNTAPDVALRKKNIDNHFHPVQHPVNLANEDTSIISFRPPPINLTAYNHVPDELRELHTPEFESPSDARSLDVGILGPPNAGKSSLMNWYFL